MPSDNEWLRRIAIALEGGSGGGSPGAGLTPADIAPIIAVLNPTIVIPGRSGIDQSFTVPVGKRWRLKAGDVTVVASSTSVTPSRRIAFQFVVAGDQFLRIPASAVQLPGETRRYVFANLPGDRDFVDDFLIVPIPDIILSAGDQMQVVGFDPSDGLGSLFHVEEW